MQKCHESKSHIHNDTWVDLTYHGDVKQVVEAGFAGVKIDSCGLHSDLEKYVVVYMLACVCVRAHSYVCAHLRVHEFNKQSQTRFLESLSHIWCRGHYTNKYKNAPPPPNKKSNQNPHTACFSKLFFWGGV